MSINNRQSGFTLLEIMISVSIIGVLLAASIPSFQSNIRHSRMEQGIALVESDLRLALARSKADGHTLEMSYGDHSVTITDLSDSTEILHRELHPSLLLNASSSTQIFPWGLVQPTEFYLHSKEDYISIQVLPTGRFDRAVPE